MALLKASPLLVVLVRPVDISKLIKRVSCRGNTLATFWFVLQIDTRVLVKEWKGNKISDCALMGPNGRRQVWQITLMVATK